MCGFKTKKYIHSDNKIPLDLGYFAIILFAVNINLRQMQL